MIPKGMVGRALAEVEQVLDATVPTQIDAMLEPMRRARKIAVYGVGREGLMMKALCMRLFHLGLDVHVVGDMTTPPLTNEDLLIVSAGPGQFSTVLGLVRVAHDAGAETMCITAEPNGAVPQLADHVIHVPAQTMARDQAGVSSILPMGSLFEVVQFLFFELLVLELRDAAGLTPAEMRANHTNLE
ncbi:MAG: SIS domain-containing protein [Boseongicola sp. SB0675_bin_26]|nr:SIS domain-containing protein [Boseongicola sp. SB0675_bin_26]